MTVNAKIPRGFAQSLPRRERSARDRDESGYVVRELRFRRSHRGGGHVSRTVDETQEVLTKLRRNFINYSAAICRNNRAQSNPRMARNDKTPDQLDAIAKDLMDASATVTAMAKAVRDAEMPVALLHGNSAVGRFLPSIIEWADKASVDIKLQIRAWKAGVQSNAELHKEKSERQKRASAKKSPTSTTKRKR